MRLPDGGDPCPHSKAPGVVNVRKAGDVVVYKEECTQCFASVDGPDGILVCVTCFNGGCDKHAALHAKKHRHSVALRLKRRPVAEEPAAEPAVEDGGDVAMKDSAAPAIVKDTKPKVTWSWDACCTECTGHGTTPSSSPWVDIDRSDALISTAAEELLASKSAAEADSVKSWENTLIQCEHTIMLQQPDDAPQLAGKSLAHCNKCELSNNLWLCMTCGHLGCGRKAWDGSGGNGHAVEHNETSGHGVVCKLGTITAEGTADIHCYRCDEGRLDPMLEQHLARFGIDIASQSKTEKTMAELDAALNADTTLFSKANEEGKEMKNVYGPGFTGFANLGNTCYMASTMQMLYALPEFQRRYFGDGHPGAEHFESCTNIAPAKCYLCQSFKLATGVLSGENSVAPSQTAVDADDEDQKGVSPRMFKNLMCSEHPDFKTMQQQDAQEFFAFITESMRNQERSARSGQDPTTTFDLEIQERLQCMSCKKVRYMPSTTQRLSLQLDASSKTEDPAALAVVLAEEERLQKMREASKARDEARKLTEALEGDAVKDAKNVSATKPADGADKKDERKKDEPPERQDLTRLERASYIPFSACVDKFSSDEAVEFSCGDCGSKEGALKRTRISRFPETLAVVMNRYTLEDWVPRKLGFQVRLPDGVAQVKSDERIVYDFEGCRGTSSIPAPGEQLMASEGAGAAGGNAGSGGAGGPPKVDELVVSALEGMGFPRVRAERAAYECAGMGPEAAMEWLFGHGDDADIDTPLSELPGAQSAAPASTGSGGNGPPDFMIEMICGMGFVEKQAKRALRETGNDVERSIEWLFSHPDESMEDDEPMPDASADSASSQAPAEPDTKPAKYELLGFVEHRGTSTRSGHYVAYLYRDGRWVHFNDRKVTETNAPPVQFAYMYFFRRL